MNEFQNSHTREFEELAALCALDALDGDERTAFEEHSASCEQCQMIVKQDQATLGKLAETVPEMDPSPGFKERLLSRASAELRHTEEAHPGPISIAPEPLQLRPRSRSVWLRPLAALLVIGVVLAGYLGEQAYVNQVVTSIPLASAGASGSAVVKVKRSGEATLELRSNTSLPSDHVYEAWVMDPAGGQPSPAGTLGSNDGIMKLDGPVRNHTVAVTVEPTPGQPTPTTPILWSGTIGS